VTVAAGFQPAVLSSEQAAWLQQRRAEMAAIVAAAPQPWARWARAELDLDGWAGTEARPTRSASWDQLDPKRREALGQVFTPPTLAGLLAGVLPASGKVLDPACGDGSLLLAALDRREGLPAALLANVEGWDRDPVAAWSCKAALVAWALRRPEGPVPGPLAVHVADALERQDVVADVVISNPPYLEAKRMGRAEPGLRERLRRELPQLEGAFDLYLAFAWRALSWVPPGGHVALLVPNKIAEGRYAAGFRAEVLERHGLEHLIDLARVVPRPFPGTSVYPAIVHLVRERPNEVVRVARIGRAEEIEGPPWDEVALADLRAVGGEHPWFVPFAETWPDLAPLWRLPRLGSVARASSTCSFHQKGLRERFVTTAEPPGGMPYLGGPSYAQKTEVEPFRTRWTGWWIRYDQGELRKIGNPLPDLDRTFRRPKVILCQHALRVRPVADFEGRWVTKDTYPVVVPTHPGWSLEALVAVLASTVFTALYNTVYQGILVGGETYHYLPAFLHTIPVPENLGPIDAIAGLVRELHEGDDPIDAAAWGRIDRAVAEAYGVTEPARQRMIDVHLRRVGAEAPE
jgi:hypothetical protein